MNFKKRANGSWTNTPHYIHNTSTDTITTLPAIIHPTGTTATVGLKGQTVQSSTPSPTSPVMPQGTGDRTGNLFYSSNNQTAGSTLRITQMIGNSKFILNKNESQTDTSANIDIDVTLPAGTYTLSVTGLNLYNNDYDRVFLRDDNSTIVVQNVQVNRPQSFTLTKTTHIYRATVVAAAQSTYNNTNISIMLNTGSTALPYEPYGIKIPILNNSQTTNVYLGEVETTRKIGKYIFTGDENITRSVSASNVRMYYVIPSAAGASPLYCTHFVDYAQAAGYPPVGYCNFNNISNFIMGVDGTEFETANDFKTWLRTQYTNGNPLTVWYVLATEETGIVNEPLRKIGDYADEVSGITIPVTAGVNTLSVDTTLQPSEITVNYRGWHPVADVHERDNGAWT